jgi:Icc protein
MSTILQITDPHLLDTEDDLLRGVPPAKTLHMILDEARKRFPNPGRIVWTGDLAESESKDGYDLFREIIGDWYEQSLFLPGNHEDRELMRAALPQIHGTGNERMSHVTEYNGWRLLLLDSREDGEVFGQLHSEDLDVITEAFRDDPDIPTLVFLHHQPVDMDSWLDPGQLRNKDALAEALTGFHGVRGIFFGHIHSEFAADFVGMRAHATPSTVFQFDITGDGEAFDQRPPGFRFITLHDSTFETGVIRLPELTYPPMSDK